MTNQNKHKMNKLQNLLKILEQDIYATKDVDNNWFVESAIKSLNNLKEVISVTQCCEELCDYCGDNPIDTNTSYCLEKLK